MERKELFELTKPLMEKLDRMSPYTYIIITSTEAQLVQEEQRALNPKYTPRRDDPGLRCENCGWEGSPDLLLGGGDICPNCRGEFVNANEKDEDDEE